MNRPNCGKELSRLGTAVSGKWVPIGIWRCTECPREENRFEMDRLGKMVKERA